MSNSPVVDSTRGSALSNPETYKRDVPMQVWLQSRHLATLMKWIENEGIVGLIRFRSDILKIVVEQLVIHLTESGAVRMIDTAQEAHAILEGRFGVPCNPDDKGKRNTLHNFELDERRHERAGGYAPPESSYERTKPITESKPSTSTKRYTGGPITKEQRKEAEAFRTNFKENQSIELAKQAKKELEEVLAKADVTIHPEFGKVIIPKGVPSGVVTVEIQEKHLKEVEIVKEKEKKEEAEKRKQYKLKVKKEKLQEQMDELDEEIDKPEEDNTPAERSYNDIVADREEKDRLQEEKLSINNDPMFLDKT